MQTVLDQLGLSDLIDRFRTQDIDDALFWTLRESDLRELGLTIGQRKKLLGVIGDASERAQPAEGLEKRRLTVLFIDMIGSTPLAERLSADDMHDLLQSTYVAASAVARRFGGYLASLQGDGMIMLFGYPRSRFGDAERALGAALAMQEDLKTSEYLLPSGARVEALFRVGVATGQAIIGTPSDYVVGGGLQMVGQVMNRAARLQSASPPGGVMVDGPTRAEVGDLFEFEARDDVVLNGIEDTTGIAQLVRRSTAQTPQQPQPTTVFGRDAENARLRGLWAQVGAGATRFALLTGEAGLGKSTVLRQFLTATSGAQSRVVSLACTSLSQYTALGPVLNHFEQLVGDKEAATPTARSEALRLILGSRPVQDLALIAGLLGLPVKEALDKPPATASRGQLIDILADWLVDTSTGRTTLVVLEDAHWCDPTTRDLMEACAERANGHPVMLLATSRNAAEPLWRTQSGVETLALKGLEYKPAEALLTRILQDHPPPAVIRQRILQRSDGNPLMLESLARSFGRDFDGDYGRDVTVPQTIYESVAERLDGLKQGRRVAAALAVLNTETDRDMLAPLLGLSPAQIDDGLQDLLRAGLVSDDRAGRACRFYHQLYRDVVYERMIEADRRDLHRKALAILPDLFPDMRTRHPDILATHALAAGAKVHAAPLALTAAELFLSRSALVEADHFFEMALTALDGLARTPDHQRLRLRAVTGMAAVKRGRLSIAADEVRTLGREMLALSRELEDRQSEMLALNGLYAHALVRADYREARDWAVALNDAARLSQDRTFTMIGGRAMGVVALHVSRFDEAEERLRAALDAYDRDRDIGLAYAHGYDHAEICAVFLSFTLWMRGDLKGARKVSAFSVSHSRDINHAHSLGQALSFRALLAALAFDDGEMADAGLEAVEMADRFDIKVARGAGLFFGNAARLLARADPPDQSDCAALKRALPVFQQFNPFNYGPLAWSVLANAYLRAGQLPDAKSCLEQAQKIEKHTDETWTSSEIARLQAQLAGLEGDSDKAADLRVRAFEHARESGAATLALRIACDMVEAEGSEQSYARLAQAADGMVSLDEGWDATRLRRLRATR
ncbi:AAA family ATPase [Primorskyibacter sp. 2E233]|uniref:AAA family ATPase n=1 Tax=Primorskyibacter sp. 2E233 TaxID=3413431 RepID=UPI003BEFCEB1